MGLSHKNFPETKDRVNTAITASSTKSRYKPLKSIFLRLQYNWTRQYFMKHPHVTAMCWNGTKGSRGVFMSAAKDSGVKTVFLERSPFQNYIVADIRGINVACGLPQNPLFYLTWSKNKAQPLNKKLYQQYLHKRRPLSKKHVQHKPATSSLKHSKYIFCPLQVNDDTQITLYSPWIQNNYEYLEILSIVSESLPEGWHLRIKEHPSSRLDLAGLIKTYESKKLRLDNTTDSFEQTEHAHAVLTINSSLGLQSFLFDKPVITLGQTFYSFENMTTQVNDIKTLQDILSKPQELTFNAPLREAFIQYLFEEYYVKITPENSEEKKFFVFLSAAKKFLKKLLPRKLFQSHH